MIELLQKYGAYLYVSLALAGVGLALLAVSQEVDRNRNVNQNALIEFCQTTNHLKRTTAQIIEVQQIRSDFFFKRGIPLDAPSVELDPEAVQTTGCREFVREATRVDPGPTLNFRN